MSLIQYISTVHTSKDEAKHNKKLCNTLHNIYCKEATFDEIADLLDSGSTIGRVGNTTDFVAIDIDNTTVNISQVQEKFKDNKDIAVSYSSSNNPLKYHILVNLHKTIKREEYKEVLETEFKKIKDQVCNRCDLFILDKNAANFYQCFFGTSVDNNNEIVLDNSKRLFKWCKIDESPMYYIENKTSREHPSLNSADYCKKHNLLTIKEDKRYDLFLPSMTNGKLKKIAEGYRYNWTKIIGAKLLMRIYYLNEKFNEGWTKFDYLDTLEWIVRTNVVLPDDFCKSDDYKGLERFFDNKWDILLDKTFEQKSEILEPYFDSSKRQYKSRQYTPTMITKIITEHQDGNNIVFEEKEELMTICNELSLDYYRTVKYIKSLGFEIVFAIVSVKERKDKGKCLEGYEVIDNTVQIPKDKITGKIRTYCSRNKIKIVKI